MRTKQEIVAAARGCIGTRFAMHGRDPEWGLDCVGLAAFAFGRRVAGDYALRGGGLARIEAGARTAGLRAVTPAMAEAGDLAVIDEGVDQLHLAILTGRGFVHADAGLRRVVETPGRPANIVAAWAEAN